MDDMDNVNDKKKRLIEADRALADRVLELIETYVRTHVGIGEASTAMSLLRDMREVWWSRKPNLEDTEKMMRRLMKEPKEPWQQGDEESD